MNLNLYYFPSQVYHEKMMFKISLFRCMEVETPGIIVYNPVDCSLFSLSTAASTS